MLLFAMASASRCAKGALRSGNGKLASRRWVWSPFSLTPPLSRYSSLQPRTNARPSKLGRELRSRGSSDAAPDIGCWFFGGAAVACQGVDQSHQAPRTNKARWCGSSSLDTPRLFQTPIRPICRLSWSDGPTGEWGRIRSHSSFNMRVERRCSETRAIASLAQEEMSRCYVS